MTTRRDEDEAAIRGQVGKIVDGLRGRDLDALQEVYADDVVSFDVEPPLRHVGRAAKLRNWANVFAVFRDVTYEVRDLTLTVSDEVAYGYGLGRLGGTLENGTATNGMWVRVTFCFRKVGDTWLIAHDQASVPFDIVTGRGVTDLEP